jgi:hypothetical protein
MCSLPNWSLGVYSYGSHPTSERRGAALVRAARERLPRTRCEPAREATARWDAKKMEVDVAGVAARNHAGESRPSDWRDASPRKLEYLNPGGSVKDRIGVSMIDTAEAEEVIERGRSVIVEPTSDNTGVAPAIARVRRNAPDGADR